MTGKAGNGVYAMRANPEFVTTSRLNAEIDEAIEWIEEIRIEAETRLGRALVSAEFARETGDNTTLAKVTADRDTLQAITDRAVAILIHAREQ